MASDEATHEAVPVAVIPLDDQEALLAKAHHAFQRSWLNSTSIAQDHLRAALTAIGVLPEQRKEGDK